jgi:predicted DsbA family dithiol-disulfide isomerase
VELLATKYNMSVEKAQAMMANVARNGLADGLQFRFDRAISGNTFDGHRLIHFAAGRNKRAEMVERLFAAYFTDGEALGDHATLARLAGDVGLDPTAVTTMLASDAFAADVRADEDRAAAFGISGVPFFAIDEKYGISGAQPASVITEALTQAFAERATS